MYKTRLEKKKEREDTDIQNNTHPTISHFHPIPYPYPPLVQPTSSINSSQSPETAYTLIESVIGI
jgi:hypothetical protein